MPYATVNGHRDHFLDAEALGYKVENGKLPIVMLHGLGGSENYYVPILPKLEGHRCIALTTYGSALSPSQGERLTMDELAEDVVASKHGELRVDVPGGGQDLAVVAVLEGRVGVVLELDAGM